MALPHPLGSVLRVFGGVVAGLVLVVIVVVGVIGERVDGKAGAPRSADRPLPAAGVARPIPQLESHTCGLLSLSAAYAVYGLSPEEKNLRFRLGVDVAAHPFDSESTGTLHPDLLRVVVQDGFEYGLLDPRDAACELALRQHLQEGDVALVLIRRWQSGGLHWILTDDCTDGCLRIVDSLESEPLTASASELLAESVLSIITLRPAGAAFSEDLSAAHRAGVAEMKRVHERLQILRQADLEAGVAGTGGP